MEHIQTLQRSIEKALSQAFSWSVDHWLVIVLCVFGAWLVLAFIASIDSRSR